MTKTIDQAGDTGTCFECGKPIVFVKDQWFHQESRLCLNHRPIPTLVASAAPIPSPDRRKFRRGDLVKLRHWDDNTTAICVEDESHWYVRVFLQGGSDCYFFTQRGEQPSLNDVLLVRAIEDASQEQPVPTPNDHPAVWDLVQADMKVRDAVGAKRYGTRLQPHNGRDVLRDAYEEALDLCAYLRQAIYERDGK